MGEDKDHYIEIRDGGDERAMLIGKYFGNQSPGRIESSENQLFIKMKTGTTSATKGFKARCSFGKVSGFTIRLR